MPVHAAASSVPWAAGAAGAPGAFANACSSASVPWKLSTSSVPPLSEYCQIL
jgi:hypothetical protein